MTTKSLIDQWILARAEAQNERGHGLRKPAPVERESASVPYSGADDAQVTELQG